jgi:hypothetical protein
MGTSGNPAKKAEQAKASSASEFKNRRKGRTLPLPSGLSVVARRVELRSFLDEGDVPNPLLPIVEEALNRGKQVDMQEIIGEKVNVDMIQGMLSMMDTIVIASVVEPPVYENPGPEDDEDDDLLYVRDFEDEDKMFIYQWALGGTDDIARFRSEATEDLASLVEGQDTRSKTKQSSRAKVK